jgi:hypothetical protein
LVIIHCLIILFKTTFWILDSVSNLRQKPTHPTYFFTS